MAHIAHFICNLHNQKLQHYVLGKNPTSVQNAITLAWKKDAEFHIMEGLHSYDSGHEINNITANQNNHQNIMGPCHACSSQHLVSDCNESICNQCRPDLDSLTPAKCFRKRPPWQPAKISPLHNKNIIRSPPNSHHDPNVKLSLSTNKQTTSLNYWQLQGKWLNTLKGHTSTTKCTMTVLTITTTIQISTKQLIQTN